jgi:hypothetical protein
VSVNVDQTGQAELLVPTEGTLLAPDDWARSAVSGNIGLAAYMDNLVGQLLGMLDVRNALPAFAPVTIAPTSAMGIQISGSAATASGTQRVIAQGRPLDTCTATPETLAAADPTNPRIDLIAVRATRTQGATTLSRTVRADNAPVTPVIVSGTLTAGDSGIIDLLSYQWSATPKVSGAPCAIGDGITTAMRASVLSATQLRVKSQSASDAGPFEIELSGTPTGYAGASQTETLYENQPAWQVVTGTPSPSPAVPPTPAGWEAFATILVPAGATSVLQANIAYLFPSVPSFATAAKGPGSAFSIPLPGGFIAKGDTITLTLDANGGSDETPYSFPVAFPAACIGVYPGADVGSADPGNTLSLPRFDSRAKTGFRVSIGGGAPSQIVNVQFLAIGY